MAKQQQPKSETPRGNQKHHNRATRGCNTRRKRLDLDLDELCLDWVEELAYFNALNNNKVYKQTLDNDMFEYRVRDEYGNLVVSIISQRNLNRSAFGVKKRRRSRRR